MQTLIRFPLLLLFVLLTLISFSQTTNFRGYVSLSAAYEKDKLSFGLGEQDLFITSSITDRLKFLGESVFKFSATSPTSFDVSIERIIAKYTLYRNHSILAGKFHTPINYWNSTYHHGVVFYPTIGRPLMFAADIFPLHTTGIGFEADNLKLGRDKPGKRRKFTWGYDLLVGNGIGSTDVQDNDNRKSITAALRLRPARGCTLSGSYYNDVIAKGAKMHDGSINNYRIKQNLWTASVAYFGKKFEYIAEATEGYNHTDTTGTKRTSAGYVYGGVKFKKWVPYVRADYIQYEKGEVMHMGGDVSAYVAGLRYQINYLAVLKLEFQHTNSQLNGKTNSVTAQCALGF